MTNTDHFSSENKTLNSTLISRGKNCRETELEGEVVLLDLSTDMFVSLDPIGSSIWKLLEPPITFSALCKNLMEEYDVEENVCRADVLSFLKDLSENGLITAKNNTND
jgi:hypothetical protein